ncbi:methionyl-tRNA formyltransferase [Arsenophonus symbiont of Ornithomya chloropus]|uniref:methionyl-tRNA formyltransferase n=1 Tax=Arsenophonus symbiont of Ornithomya chloropus TaxID=634121 RepID=UPI0032B25782
MSHYLRIIFAGTPDFAAQHLKVLVDKKDKYEIIGVLTQPDKPSGRGKKITSSAVKILANKMNIPVFQPKTLKTKESQNWIKNQHADIMIVIAYGIIIPEIVLNLLPMGCINLHCSLLPRWRGATPIQHSILAGDKTTGISIIQMDIGIDTGNILYQTTCPIEINDTTRTLYQKLEKIGPIALQNTLDLLTSGKIKSKKQNHIFVKYAKKIKKKEALINWKSSAIQIERCIRAFNPWPVSYFIIENTLIKVWDAQVIFANIYLSPGTILNVNKTGLKVITSKNILNILKIQPAGKKIMLVKNFINSHHKLFIPGKIIH